LVPEERTEVAPAATNEDDVGHRLVGDCDKTLQPNGGAGAFTPAARTSAEKSAARGIGSGVQAIPRGIDNPELEIRSPISLARSER
jgi:hypothetical protein